MTEKETSQNGTYSALGGTSKPQKDDTTKRESNNTSGKNKSRKKSHSSTPWGKKVLKFRTIKIAQILCAAYILTMTFSPLPFGCVDPETGNIVDISSPTNTENGLIFVNGSFRPIVAVGLAQKACLAASRVSAFSMYPVLIAVFASKCRATFDYVYRTPLAMFVSSDLHEIHAYAGSYIAFDALLHTTFHLTRWFLQGNLRRLCWGHITGRTGLVSLVVVPLLVWPMLYWKKALRYEIRKALHYLFFVFALGLCWHVPTSAVPNGGFLPYILGICLGWYTLDALYVTMVLTEKIDTTRFEVLPGSGVQMTMTVSEAFQRRSKHGGYVYICLPWIDRTQWHAFSLFEAPEEEDKEDSSRRRQVFMQATGDWTNAVHDTLRRRTVRPVWVQGPFQSPYDNAVLYDNQILVASGIGITPALSVIRAHSRNSRRTNLIWAVRDPYMLEFYLQTYVMHRNLDHNEGWNLVFYTGKEPLAPALRNLNTNVKIVTWRPDLKEIIPNIIFGIEGGLGLPESRVPSTVERVKASLVQKVEELDRHGTELTNAEKVKRLSDFARSEGMVFSELLECMMEDEEHFQGGMGEHWFSQRDYDEESQMCESSKSLLDDKSRASFDDGNNHSQSSMMMDGIPHTPQEDSQVMRRLSAICRRLSQNSTTFKRDASNLAEDLASLDDSASVASGIIHKPPYRKTTLMKEYSSRRLLRERGAKAADAKRKNGKLRLSQALTEYKHKPKPFHPWEHIPEAKKYVKSLNRSQVLDTWGILYCGGSKAVESTLKEISEEYKIRFHTESFSW